MKKSTKLLVGIGVTAVIGTTVAVVVSEQIVNSVRQVKNRYLVKQFIDDYLGKNQQLLKIADKLSADETETVASIIKRIKADREKITVAGQNFKDTTEEVKSFLTNFLGNLA